LPPPGAHGNLARMGLPAEQPRRATYADLEAVPPHQVAEILGGVLHVFPRPAPRHAAAASQLGGDLGPFRGKRGKPGGWWILDEPELHFGPADAEDVVVPDLAGWRLERMPRLPRTAYFTLAPDWVCEILSASTEALDRIEKMPIYAREGVRHAWLLHPVRQTLEVFRRNADGLWVLLAAHGGAQSVRAEPFGEIEIDLSALWAEVEGDEEEERARPPSKPRARRPAVAKGRPQAKKR
jgi:Uma2 family endonuclease